MRKLLTNCVLPVQGISTEADAHSVSHSWINANISTSARSKTGVFYRGCCWILTPNKGEVEEEEEREDARRCRWQ